MRGARPSPSTAATESPPPTMTDTPASARSARKRAMAFVPSANCRCSKTPIGPFQKTVLALARCSVKAATVSGPISTTI
jgi:hypothetical protein